MDSRRQISIVRRSSYFDPGWYLARHPAVAASGLDPAAHYVQVGAARGDDPGPQFDTATYLRAMPQALTSGMVPLVHYLLCGMERGALVEPEWNARLAPLAALQRQLLTLGFTQAPLADLEAMAETAGDAELRVGAAFEIAQWHMRAATPFGARACLAWLDRARKLGPTDKQRQQILVLDMIARCGAGDKAGAQHVYQQAAPDRDLPDDAVLARANAEDSAEARLPWLNIVFGRGSLAPAALAPGDAAPAFDRLRVPAPPPIADADRPLVSVLVAAHDSADTLPTALQSLVCQTWQALEILVVDDCSPSAETMRVATEFSRRDTRVRAVRMPVNGGAYAARNVALQQARGAYVTLLDADDWAHPEKIARQMRYLHAAPDRIGCMSLAARISEQLDFPRWSGGPGDVSILRENMSSFLSPLQAVLDRVGPWDTVRVGADSERIKRIRRAFGERAVATIDSGMVGLSRLRDGSAVENTASGVNGFLFGARDEYRQSFEHHHRQWQGAKLPESLTERAFPVPAILRAGPRSTAHFDVIIASDFRAHCGGVQTCIDEIDTQRALGLRTGLVSMATYGQGPINAGVVPAVRARIDGESTCMIVHGEAVTCDLLLVRYPPVLQHPQRYVPQIDAGQVRVVVNTLPHAATPTGGPVFDFARCQETLSAISTKPAIWHPADPLIRAAMETRYADAAAGLVIAAEDWADCLASLGDALPPPDAPTGPLRIGRHGADLPTRFPANGADLLAAYPPAPGVEVAFLGGATAALALLGRRPANWITHAAGTMPASAFLIGLDAFVDFPDITAHPGYGRTVIEAMSAGIPVILPDSLRGLFGDAALYTTATEAPHLARRLRDRPETRALLVNRAFAFVRTRHAPQHHRDRLAASGVTALG